MPVGINDAHRHIGRLPPWPFYGGPPVAPALRSPATVAELVADLDREGTERTLVIPNYGVPDPEVAFALNELCLDAASADEWIVAGLWVSARPGDEALTTKWLQVAGEAGVGALKLSFLLGGSPTDPACRPLLDQIFATARTHGLVVHVHTSPGASSDIDQVGHLVDWYGDEVAIHLVHLGGGMSGHIKLIGGRLRAGHRVGGRACRAAGLLRPGHCGWRALPPAGPPSTARASWPPR